ncbi:MAG: hypothetical protein GY768_31640 [Planctomycetaceae bacterium]|nr:hypothetical protein [Planctomycetaceae bacterium]
MADGYIWVSNVLNDSSLVVGTDVDSEESARKSIFKREYPANKDLPARLYAHYKDEAFDKGLPELFTGGGGTKISPKLADIFRQFNLGSGRTCPLKLYLHDRKTPVDLEIFLLYWWEQRQFLDLEKSIGLRGRRPSRVQPNPPPPDKWGVPWELSDGDIVIAPRDLGGLDFWYDTKLRGALFFSNRLCQALRDAGYARLFKFRKCTVLPVH